MKYTLISLLLLSLTLSACTLTGRAFDVPINTSVPGLYIDGPDRVDIVNVLNGAPYPLIGISIIAAQYENISGFEFDLNYNGPISFAPPTVPGGIFGTVSGVTYVCVTPQSITGAVNNLACAGLPGASTTPNTDGYSHLYNLTFLTTGAGQVYFSINTVDTLNGPTIVVDSSNERLELAGNTAHKTINVCMDADGDGEFSTLACESDGTIDCRDDLSYVNTNHIEWCNNFDNNCNGRTDDAVNCEDFKPQINRIYANTGIDLFDDQDPGSNYNPPLSGLISFSVEVTDTSIGNDGTSTGNNVDRVEFYVENNLIGTDNVDGKTTYSINDWNSVGQPDDTALDLRVVVVDKLDPQVPRAELTKQFTLNNEAICDITSVAWDRTSVTDGGSVGLTVIGSAECDGKEYTLSSGNVQYLECDASSCEPIPANIASSLPGNTISFAGSTTFTDTGFANWFLDIGGTDNNPEIKIRITDDVTGDLQSQDESGLLEIVNIAPVIENQSVIVGIDSAQIYMTVSDPSRFTLEYGASSTNLDQSQSTTIYQDSETFTLTGLQPQTTYYYRITARDEGNLAVNTGILNFTTVTYRTDFDQDGDVDIFDVYDAIRFFRARESQDQVFWNNNNLADYDLDSNGVINIIDLTLMLATFTG